MDLPHPHPNQEPLSVDSISVTQAVFECGHWAILGVGYHSSRVIGEESRLREVKGLIKVTQ